MENQESRSAKASNEAIKSLVYTQEAQAHVSRRFTIEYIILLNSITLKFLLLNLLKLTQRVWLGFDCLTCRIYDSPKHKKFLPLNLIKSLEPNTAC